MLARAAGGRIAIDVWRLIQSGTLLAARIELDAPRMVIARVGANQFALASEIMLGDGGSGAEALTLDDLPAGTLAIRGGTFTLQGWNPALPLLELHGVNLDLRRDGDTAALAASLRLPEALGGALSVNGAAYGLGDLASLRWSASARARGISVAGWRKLLPEYVKRLDAGMANFDISAQGRGGEPSRADLGFAASGVVAQLSDEPSTRFDQWRKRRSSVR